MIKKAPVIAAVLLLAACQEPKPTVDQFKGTIQETSELLHVKGDLHDQATRVLRWWSVAEEKCGQSRPNETGTDAQKAVKKLNKEMRELIIRAFASKRNLQVELQHRYGPQLTAAQNLLRFNGWQAKCVNTRLEWEISFSSN